MLEVGQVRLVLKNISSVLTEIKRILTLLIQTAVESFSGFHGHFKERKQNIIRI